MSRSEALWVYPVGILIVGLLCSAVCTAAAPAATPAPVAPVARGEDPVRVGVFYLTNRSFEEGKSVAETYSGDRGEPHFGHCEVEFEPIPIINQVTSKVPFYIKSETNAVTLVQPSAPPRFWEQFTEAAGRTASGSVVLFVHGYNYGFVRTCRMAAEMQRYLEGRATVLVFSWPSNGLPADYARDQADIDWSVPLLADIISELGQRVGREKLRVVAHSLGSRGVIQSLQQLATQTVERPVIAELVLLAPDFDSQTFVDLLPGLAPMVSGITLYASGNDTPLKLSRQLYGYPRLGEAGEYLTLVEGVETIDVSSVGRYQITGHEYFYYHPQVTADLVALLGTGDRAAMRPGLRERTRHGLRYWEFVQTKAEGDPQVSVED